MSPFAGYNMPVLYSGINDEHRTVRNHAGVFDVSHMGEFIVRGTDALSLVQHITTNDVTRLVPGKVQYSCITNEKGGIIDDLLVYMLDEKTFMLVVNASNIEKDFSWIKKHNRDTVELIDISDKTSLLAVQGPDAVKILQPLTKMDLASISYYSFLKGEFAGHKNVLVSATGYTGAGGFEIYFENGMAVSIWDRIFSAGKDFGIKPIGLGARDTLRMEMGYCLYGNDIDETTTPLEAGLGWITKLNKEFVGSDYLRKQKAEGITKKLVGFEMIDRGIPRHGYELIHGNGNIIGRVTSGTQSPTLQTAIGMGYVSKEFSDTGTKIGVRIRDKSLTASVIQLPFIRT